MDSGIPTLELCYIKDYRICKYLTLAAIYQPSTLLPYTVY